MKTINLSIKDTNLYKAIERSATNDLRSVTSQLNILLKEALDYRKRDSE